MRQLLTAVLFSFIAIGARAQFQGLIVNEFSQGDQLSREYIELLVVGTRTCTDSTADLRNWIFDDQNGWYGAGNISTGHYRFANVANWAAVPYGSLILFYNSASNEKNLSITAADDPTDANHDYAYILPINSNNYIEENSTEPLSTSGPGYIYPLATVTTGYTGSSNLWINHIALNNTQDVISTVSPSDRTTAFFSIAYSFPGSPGFHTPTVSVGNVGAGRNCFLSGTSYNVAAAWVLGNAEPSLGAVNETPALPNGGANTAWIVSMRQQAMQPPAPVVSVVQPNCTNSVGSIQIISPVGPGYSYSKDGINYSPFNTIFTNLAPGSYPITARISGCTSPITTVVINSGSTTPAIPATTITQPDCNNATGIITVNTPTGAGFTYSIGGPYQASTVFTGVVPGLYGITAKNSSGCTSGAGLITIDPPPPIPTAPTVNITSQPDCSNPAGSITITAPPGMSYSINGSDYSNNSGIFSNLAAGTYTATAKNSFGCTSPGTTFVINPPSQIPPTPVVTIGQTSCSSTAGTIIINSPIGTGLLYSIDGVNYSNQTVFNNLLPGSYAVTVQNTLGCKSSVLQVTINTPPPVPPAPTLNIVQPSCNTPTGSIIVNSPSGINYSIDGTDFTNSTGIFTSLLPGNYNVAVQNGSGCISPAVVAIVNLQPSAPVVSVNSPTICPGATATISASVSVAGSYSYVWTVPAGEVNPGNVSSFNAATAGNYTVILSTTSNCSTNASGVLTITSLGAVTADNKTVCQNSTVQLTGQPAGGSWSGSAVNGNIFDATGLGPGNYSVTYSYNSGGCSGSATATVTIAALPATPITSVIQPGCTTTNGSITVTSPSGTDLSFSIDGTNYTSNNIFVNLTPANYLVTVQNTSGCISSANAVIDPPPASTPAPTVGVTHPTCTNNTGTITITNPAGGLFYSVDGIVFQNNQQFNGLVPGTYNVTVKTSSGCISPATITTINPAPPLPQAATVSITQATCTVPGGTIAITSPIASNLNYSIDGTNYQPSPVFGGLAPGSYAVTVKDNSGCISLSTAAVINASPSSPPKPSVTIVQPTCITPTGSITINSPTGSTYSYSINGINYNAVPVFSSLTPASYTVSVKNASGCISDTVVTITQGQANFTLNVTGPPGSLLCPIQGMPQTISATPSASDNYIYSWTVPGGAINPGNVQAFTITSVGNYSVTATNTNGCSASASILINPATPVTPSIVDDKQVCLNSTVGLTTQMPGGSWSGNFVSGSSFDATGVTPGTYQAFYLHPLGSNCTYSIATITVVGLPAAPTVAIVDQCDGSSTLTASNYSGSLLWSNNATTPTITVAGPGTYSVVQTVNGCVSPSGNGTAAPMITQIQTQTINGCNSVLHNGTQYFTSTVLKDTLPGVNGCDSIIQIVNINISQSSNAFITVCKSAGEVYDFNGQVLTMSGEYMDTLSAATGCDSVIHLKLLIATVQTNTLTGCETVLFNGTGYTTSTILTQVISSITTGCDSVIQTTNIIVHPRPLLETISDQKVCKGDPVVLTATSNGASIQWQGLGNGSTVTVFPTVSSTYFVVATNNPGCTDTASVTVDIQSFDVILTALNNSFITGNTVQLQTSSTSPYQVLAWTPVNLFPDQKSYTQTFILDSSLIISVIAKSQEGCKDTGTLHINADPLTDIYIPDAFTPNGDGKNDVFKVLGGTIKTLDLKIFNRWGQLIFNSKERARGWDGKWAGKEQPGTVYVYLAEMTLLNGKKITKKGTVTLIR